MRKEYCKHCGEELFRLNCNCYDNEQMIENNDIEFHRYFYRLYNTKEE